MSKMTAADKRLIQAAKEMAAHYRGELALPSYRVLAPDQVDIVSIRNRFGYTQKQFADYFGFALSALKDWEQGRRKPERSARLLLAVIASNPKVVEKALRRYAI